MKNLVQYGSFEKPAAPSVVRRNLVTNPSFEVDLSTYSTETNVSITRVASDLGMGAWGMQVEWIANAANSLQAAFSGLTAGVQYRLSFYVKSGSGAPNIRYKVGDNGTVGSFQTSSNWQRVSHDFTVPTTGANTNRLYLYRISTASLENMIIDAVMIEQTDQLRPYFDGSTAAANGVSYSWFSAAHSSISVASSNLVEVQRNLAPFGSFEAGVAGTTEVRRNLAPNPTLAVSTSGWGVRGTGTNSSRVESGGPNNAPFLRNTLTSNNASWWRNTINIDGLVSRETYTVSAMVRSSSFRGGNVILSWAGAGESSSGTPLYEPGVWTRVSYTVTVPAGITAARLEFGVTTGGSTGDTFDTTQVLVEQTTQLRPYFDGSSELSGFSYSWVGAANASASIARSATTSVLTNLAAYGSFETAQSGTTEVRRNSVLKPSFSATGDQFGGNMGNNAGVSTATTPDAAYSGGHGVRRTATATGGAIGWGQFSEVVQPGTYIGSLYVRSSVDLEWITAYTQGTATGRSQQWVVDPSTGLQYGNRLRAGEWRRVFMRITVAGTAGTVQVGILPGTPFVIGQYIDMDRFMLEQTDQSRPYFDGSSLNEKGFTTEWAGTANASASIMRAATVTVRENLLRNPSFEADLTDWAAAGTAGTTLTRATDSASPAGGAYLRAETTGASVDQGIAYAAATTPVSAGTSYTLSSWVLAPAGTPMVISAVFQGGDNISATGAFTATGAWQRVSHSVVAPNGAAWVRLALRVTQATPRVFYVDACMVEASPVMGDYFDGATPNSGDFINAWTGAANASTSVQQGIRVLNAAQGAAGSAITPYMGLASPAQGSSNLAVRVYAANTSFGFGPGPVATAGTVYTAVAWLRARNRNTRAYLRIGAVNGAVATLTNEWQLVRRTATSNNSAPSSTGLLVDGSFEQQQGDVLEMDGFTLVEGDHPNLMPFDGSSVSTDSDLTYAWTGTPFASTSELRGIALPGIYTSPGVVAAVQSGAWRSSSLRLVSTGGGTNNTHLYISSASLGMVLGKTYTVAARARIAAPQTGSLHNRARSIVLRPGGGGSDVVSESLPNTAGDGILRATVTIGAVNTSTGGSGIYLYNGSTTYGEDIWWDDLTVAEGTLPNLMPYTGSTTSSNELVYGWAGMPHESAAVISAPGVLGLAPSNTPAASRSTVWKAKGVASLRVEPTAPTNGWRAFQLPDGTLKPNTTYTLVAYGFMPSPSNLGSPLAVRVNNVYMGNSPTNVTYNGMFQVSLTFTATAGMASVNQLVLLPRAQQDTHMFWDTVTLVEGTYNGPPFNGESFGATWDGTPHESTSQKPLPALTYWNAATGVEDWVQAQILP